MTAAVLSADQRWLLRMVGGWAMRDCLVGPDGVDRLMASMYGGTGRRTEGGPDWMAGGFQCGSGRIVSPGFGEPVVTVTKALLNRYAKALPQTVTDELRAIAKASRTEHNRAWEWCRCPNEHTPPNPHAGVCRSYHPNDQQVDEHYRELRRLNTWQDRALDRALGLTGDAAPVGQLDLFGATA